MKSQRGKSGAKKSAPKEQTPLPLMFNGAPTFDRLAEDFLSQRVPMMRKGSRAYYASKLKWWRAVLAEKPHPVAGDFVLAVVERMKEGAPGRLNEVTANQYLKAASAVFKHATQNYPLAVVRNPLAESKRWTFDERSLKPVALKDPEGTLPRLLAAMPDARARALLLVLRWQGLRIGEACGITWEAVRWGGGGSGGALAVLGQRDPDGSELTDPKAKASAATMPLHRDVVRALRAVRAADALADERGLSERRARFVFHYAARCWGCQNARPCGGRMCLDALMAICRAVAPEDFPVRAAGRGAKAWHVLRHTLGADLERRGVAMGVAQRVLRHASIGSTGAYFQKVRGAQLSTEDMAAAWGTNDSNGKTESAEGFAVGGPKSASQQGRGET